MAPKKTGSVTQSAAERAILDALGQRVRSARAARGMTRRILARDSAVSERYLAQLEAGRGNVSILVLHRIAAAMAMPVDMLLSDAGSMSPRRRQAYELTGRLDEEGLTELLLWLRSRAEREGALPRGRRIALIGLRGAGKSTLGQALASEMAIPFLELNRVIEAEYGGPLDDLFSLAGQPAYRRYESRCLERILQENEAAVIAAGGGIVTNEAAFAALLEFTHTIWVQASPEEHMARVVAQGDLRPMADNREAMGDLRQILAARETAYGQALRRLDTSGKSVETSISEICALSEELLPRELAAE